MSPLALLVSVAAACTPNMRCNPPPCAGDAVYATVTVQVPLAPPIHNVIVVEHIDVAHFHRRFCSVPNVPFTSVDATKFSALMTGGVPAAAIFP